MPSPSPERYVPKKVVIAQAKELSSPGGAALSKSEKARKVDQHRASIASPQGIGNLFAPTTSQEEYVSFTEHSQEEPSSHRKFRYLALGDSYTIGECVPALKAFPNEIARLLKLSKQGGPARFGAVDVNIVAKTGWTTDELLVGLEESKEHLDDSTSSEDGLFFFDLVTLCIGVNNQYRGRSSGEYAAEFEDLLKKALLYAGDGEAASGINTRGHVVVLSIPDWGVTPFAKEKGRNSAEIAMQIDEFNAINYKIARRHKVLYLDVTPWTREAAADSTLLAEDGLHPSAREYTRWAEAVVSMLKENTERTKKTQKTPPNGKFCEAFDFGSALTSLFKMLGLASDPPPPPGSRSSSSSSSPSTTPTV